MDADDPSRQRMNDEISDTLLRRVYPTTVGEYKKVENLYEALNCFDGNMFTEGCANEAIDVHTRAEILEHARDVSSAIWRRIDEMYRTAMTMTRIEEGNEEEDAPEQEAGSMRVAPGLLSAANLAAHENLADPSQAKCFLYISENVFLYMLSANHVIFQ